MNWFVTFDQSKDGTYSIVHEKFCVDELAVCQGFCQAAIGIPHGTWLKNMALARRGPGELIKQESNQDFRREATAALQAQNATAFGATVNWWRDQFKLWDYIPTERMIVHPHIVFNTYFTELYVPEFTQYYNAKPLMLAANAAKAPGRWFVARTEALRQVGL